MPMRRCSAESTMKMPPRDQKAWPPRLEAFSWSMRTTGTPRCVSSKAATRPARPAPMMRTGCGAIMIGILPRDGEGRCSGEMRT
ncbi:putative FAD binding domain-containing protein [Podospora aff. communis PSN243]|uniref:FAD binding domain-containing protein n=1 Tax=Podospora aff. communis PSN243 TaxID=3040156 RepID=A0AAV9G4W3_9PEZI|nr:putative FAD binding domain-containing protein [Podospora aff. communis PSN243]